MYVCVSVCAKLLNILDYCSLFFISFNSFFFFFYCEKYTIILNIHLIEIILKKILLFCALFFKCPEIHIKRTKKEKKNNFNRNVRKICRKIEYI